MSLILDALKRSRSEDSAVPGVDTYHAPPEQAPAWRAYLPWFGLGVAALVVAWLLLERYGVFPGGAGSGEEGAMPVRMPAPVQRPQPPAQVPPAPRVQAAPQFAGGDRSAPAAPSGPVAAVPDPVPPPAAQVEPDPAVAELYHERDAQSRERGTAEASSRPAAGEARAGAATGRASTPQVEEQPLDLEGMLQQAKEELDAGEFVDHPAPFITSLSQQARDPIPTILYQRHEYSGQSGRASVVMNGKTLRVGGSPAAGVKLEEILPNSSVLNYRGTQFRLRALNSWVNL